MPRVKVELTERKIIMISIVAGAVLVTLYTVWTRDTTVVPKITSAVWGAFLGYLVGVVIADPAASVRELRRPPMFILAPVVNFILILLYLVISVLLHKIFF